MEVAAGDGGIGEFGWREQPDLGVLVTVAQHGGLAGRACVGEDQDSLALNVVDPGIEQRADLGVKPKLLADLTSKRISWAAIGALEPTAGQLPLGPVVPQDDNPAIPAEHALH